MPKLIRSQDHILARETPIKYQGRALIVELAPGYLKIRRKGTRTSEVSVTWEAIYELGLKMQARADREAGKGA